MQLNRKVFLLFLIIITAISMLACNSSIEQIKPFKVDTPEKEKILLLPFGYKENIFPIETNEILSQELTTELSEWLNMTNGFETQKITTAEPKPSFNLNYISFTKKRISPPLIEYATDNGYDTIIKADYNIDNTIASSDTNKVYSVTINMLSYNIKKEKFEFEQSSSTVVGIDISLFVGEQSIIKNSEENSEDAEIKKMNKIIKRLLPTFEKTIAKIGNDYTKYIYEKEDTNSNTTTANNEEQENSKTNNDSNDDEEQENSKTNNDSNDDNNESNDS